MALAEIIAKSASGPRVVGVQIDFDATSSERVWYRQLLIETRRVMDPDLPLSMTALASWCVGDPWLDGLPIDEAVPMLFRMGPTNDPYASIGVSPSSADPGCRSAVGTSLDEPLPLRPDARRVYVFTDTPWNPSAVAAARRIVQ